MDTAATSSLTHRGHIVVDNGGFIGCGTTGSPLSASYTASIIATTVNAGVVLLGTGSSIFQGTPKSSTTLFKTTYVSGVGTAADPLIVADAVDWSVGDEILVSPGTDSATNYNETESRFIITKNSATSYVVSTTSGGGEAALTYTKDTSTVIANVQRNIIIKGSSTVVPTGFLVPAQAATGTVDVDWVRFENLSAATFLGAVPTNTIYITNNVEMDYCVGYNGAAGLFWIFGNSTANTRRGLIAYNTLTASPYGSPFANIAVYSTTNKTLEDCISFGSNNYGISVIASSYTNTLIRCKAFGGTNANVLNAGFAVDAAGKNQFTDCDGSANRGSGLYLISGPGNTFTSCDFGTSGTNGTQDVYMGTGFSTALLESCNFGSATLISNYLNMTLGSEIAFDTMNGTTNNHAWYDAYGSATAEATVVRSPGLSVKIRPENLATGFTWQFQIPVAQYSVARFLGYFLKNATLGTSVVTISMYLPGNPVGGGVPDVSTTLSNTTGATFTVANEQAVSLVANYTGGIPGVATVLVNVKSNTAGAYLYADDFFNAGDRTTTFDSVTGLNTWVNGKPIGVISPLVPSAADTAAAVWGADKDDNNTAGTMGRLQNKALSVAKFLGLK